MLARTFSSSLIRRSGLLDDCYNLVRFRAPLTWSRIKDGGGRLVASIAWLAQCASARSHLSCDIGSDFMPVGSATVGLLFVPRGGAGITAVGRTDSALGHLHGRDRLRVWVDGHGGRTQWRLPGSRVHEVLREHRGAISQHR